jgi:hypothetical protein
LFFAPVPPSQIFRALITSFAGYWRPSIATRAWQALFFALVWLRNRVPAASRVAEAAAGVVRKGSVDRGRDGTEPTR